jgi:hypothetical protein
MTGPEHFQEAERLLEAAGQAGRLLGEAARACREAAQVHATLALAAATALSRWSPESGFLTPDRTEWYHVASRGNLDREAERAEMQT